MKRMLLVAAVALVTVATSSGCRLFGNNGDRCDPCSISRSDCGSAPIIRGGSGTMIMPAPAPNSSQHHVLPGPVEPTS